jgi:hypothetical protein
MNRRATLIAVLVCLLIAVAGLTIAPKRPPWVRPAYEPSRKPPRIVQASVAPAVHLGAFL